MKTAMTDKVRRLTLNAVLAAIVAVVSFLPLRTLGLEITFSMIPVAIGAIVLGPASGAFLGGVFGVVSFLQCLGYSSFGATLFAINPVFTFLTCVPTRILAGMLAGLIFRAVPKKKSDSAATATAAVCAPILNTLFFMGTLTVCFYNTEYIQGFAELLNATNPINFILLFVGMNGIVEIICGFALALPISKVIRRVVK